MTRINFLSAEGDLKGFTDISWLDIVKPELTKVYYYKSARAFVSDRDYIKKIYQALIGKFPGLSGRITLLPV